MKRSTKASSSVVLALPRRVWRSALQTQAQLESHCCEDGKVVCSKELQRGKSIVLTMSALSC
ncbi:MAG TPA: hypothetical protein DEF45_20685 [Rhodopirellula sp.]|nr:hypothetical protein [Rhodopirellula sp.]